MDSRTQTSAAETLPEELVAAYRADGFVHVPRVLAPVEVAELVAEARGQLTEHETMTWDIGGGAIAFDWVADADRRSPALRGLALHPGIAGIAERLAGGALRLFKSELLRKQPHGRSAITPPHDDRKTFPFDGEPAALTAWVALVDVPAERGCLAFIPGSHLRSERPEQGADADVYPLSAWPELARAPRVAVPLRAGDATFHHERTVHLAGANRTGTTRIALATVYMSAAATYRHSPYYANLYPQDPDLGGMSPGQPLRGERFPRVR